MKRPFYKFREPPGKAHPAYTQGDSWAEELGFAWSAAHARLIPESRAVAILRREGIEAAGEAHRIIAE